MNVLAITPTSSENQPRLQSLEIYTALKENSGKNLIIEGVLTTSSEQKGELLLFLSGKVQKAYQIATENRQITNPDLKVRVMSGYSIVWLPYDLGQVSGPSYSFSIYLETADKLSDPTTYKFSIYRGLPGMGQELNRMHVWDHLVQIELFRFTLIYPPSAQLEQSFPEARQGVNNLARRYMKLLGNGISNEQGQLLQWESSRISLSHPFECQAEFTSVVSDKHASEMGTAEALTQQVQTLEKKLQTVETNMQAFVQQMQEQETKNRLNFTREINKQKQMVTRLWIGFGIMAIFVLLIAVKVFFP